MTLPPPRSTLFPYTTLFRSDGEPRRRRLNDARLGIPDPHVRQHRTIDREAVAFDGNPAAFDRLQRVDVRDDGRGHGPGDRKSTRLNSSHQIISYAVFCLKKK